MVKTGCKQKGQREFLRTVSSYKTNSAMSISVWFVVYCRGQDLPQNKWVN